MSVSELFKGILIGIASILPGVSGGTLAVSMGVYDRIISAVTGLRKYPRASLHTLLPYVLGAGIGIVGFSFTAEYLFVHYPLQTSLAFMGLILSGIPAVWDKIQWKSHPRTSILLVTAVFSLILLMTYVPKITNPLDFFHLPKLSETYFHETLPLSHMIKMLLVGTLAAATLVIPGISGSMLLMMLGVYQPLLTSINRFLRQLLSLHAAAAAAECLTLVPFGLGILFGIYLCACLISLLFQRFESLTYCAILGLILVSPTVILLEIPAEAFSVSGILTGGLLMLLGLLSARYL